MCGRYYVDDDAIDEAGIFTNRKYPANLNRSARDIYPNQYATILARGSDISPDDAQPTAATMKIPKEDSREQGASPGGRVVDCQERKRVS